MVLKKTQLRVSTDGSYKSMSCGAGAELGERAVSQPGWDSEAAEGAGNHLSGQSLM